MRNGRSWIVFVAAVCAAGACAFGDGNDTAGPGRETAMFRVISDSPSIVLRSTHILAIRVESAEPAAWLPLPEGGTGRTVRLGVTLTDILKGTTAEAAGDAVAIEIAQYGTGTSRQAAVPGAWSGLPLDPGAEYVVFCQGTAGLAAELLRDPWCVRVDPAADALADVRLALEIETGELGPEEALDRAATAAARLGFVFSEYLWTTSAMAILTDQHAFERFLEFLEHPSLAPVARSILLDSVYSGVSSDSEEPWRVAGLTFTLFHLLDTPEASALHDNIVSPFLPNLLGLTGAAGRRSADDVFHGFPDERAGARQALEAYSGPGDTAPLLDWLR